MSRAPDVEIFPPAKCCVKGCLELWEKWCRGCNLVFCGGHIVHGHSCPKRGSLGAPRKLPQGAQGLERGSVKKYNAPGSKNGRGKH